MQKLIIWYNPQKDQYYYRIVRGLYYERYEYKVGAENSYGHVIKLIIPITDLIDSIKPHSYHTSLKKKVYIKVYKYLKKRI